MRRLPTLLILLLLVQTTTAQLRTFTLGERTHTWQGGGDGVDPVRLVGRFAAARADTGNVPGDAIEFVYKPGWISPQFFDGTVNISPLLLGKEASIKAPNSLSVRTSLRREQLTGIVNGDHEVAFERKPTLFNPNVPAFGIWIVMDFARLVGVERIRFYPRNSVLPTPDKPFHNDFLRGYEVWVNRRLTNSSGGAPDVLVARVPENEEPVVDLPMAPRYVRLVKLRSITETPFEIDEIEIYGTGYVDEATYYSDLIDLGGRATLGPIRWVEQTVGKPLFSHLSAQVRTGNDDTPIVFREKIPTQTGRSTLREVSPKEYWELDATERAPLIEDTENWSAWRSLENGQLHTAPGPRRYVQFLLKFRGRLFDAREVNRLTFSYLTPPLADTLRAEIFPRLAETEKPATFRYAVLLQAAAPVLGFDRLEVDTIVPAAGVRDLTLDGEPVEFEVVFINKRRFRIALPLIARDGALLEFTFDLPIFRFGTTFSGRAYNSRFPTVPQRLQPGQAADLGPGDFDEVSDLSVVIPKPQIGKLVGEISIFRNLFTPNGDGVNDEFELFFNLLQLVKPAPVRMDIYDLAGRRVHTIFAEEREIGPVTYSWDGRLEDGTLVRPGNYLWVLKVKADAFEERHSGVMGVAY